METIYNTEDIRKLYNAFVELCDHIEEEHGCGTCPLWEPMCGNKDKTSVKEFAQALARIREVADIPNP